MFVECWGVCPKPGHKGLFEKSPLESQKLRQSKWVCSVQKFWGFLRDFFKSPLKRRFGTAVPTYYEKIKKHGNTVLFVCVECWGVCPKPGHKKLFVKSFLWNFKNFCHNKSMYSVGNSFAYFSYKKSKWEILWHTFFRKKGVFLSRKVS